MSAVSTVLARAVRRPSVTVPVLGEVTMPPPDRLVYYVGLGVLAAFEVIEWPVALVIAAGHLLADNAHDQVLRGLGVRSKRRELKRMALPDRTRAGCLQGVLLPLPIHVFVGQLDIQQGGLKAGVAKPTW